MSHVILEGRADQEVTLVYGLRASLQEEAYIRVLGELGVAFPDVDISRCNSVRILPKGCDITTIHHSPTTIMNKLGREGFKVACSALMNEYAFYWTLVR